jgi:hypothetical protein
MGMIGSLSRRFLKNLGTACGCRTVARSYLLASITLSLSGCASFGPTSVDRDRLDYITTIASSWKQQTLLNIVKMRYADTPIFLEVGQIISGYQLSGAVTVGGSLSSSSAYGDILNLGGAGTYTDRPTITYMPLMGAHFLQVMMTPIPPPNLLKLAQEGWPIDMLLQMGAQSINGLSNRKGGARGHAADPDFVRLLAALQRLQASGAVELRVEVSKETKQEGTVMVISPKPLLPDVETDRTMVRKLLGLRSDLQEFKIIYGALSGNDNVVAVQTRSAFQILNLLGSNVEVPPEHIADGRTYPPITESADMTLTMPRLIRIHSEKSHPADAFAAVKYSDYWYWIDNRDFRSKGVFTFLMVMMTLADKGSEVQPPVITIQGN